MARRALLVAIAAIATAFIPASANAAVAGSTPTFSTGYGNPVTINWLNVDASTTSQIVWRSTGPCGAIPSLTATSFPVAVDATTLTDTTVPGDGTYCYYVEADDAVPSAAFSGGVAVKVDTTAPSAGLPTVTPASPVRALAAINATNSDAGSGVATSVAHVGVGACNGSSPLIVGTSAAWNTATPSTPDGTYVVCNVVTDVAGNPPAVSPGATVVIDNTAPTGAVLTPSAGAIVHGNAFVLTASAADPNGVANVQWQRSANGTTWNAAGNIGAPVTAAPYTRNWNTTAGGIGDGPDWVRAVITDKAGNQAFVVANVTVDNTKPDVAPVVTAPPAVAGSPTLSWTTAHDAMGVVRYDVLRGTLVVGSVTSTGAPTYSFSDKTAPDQTTVSYTVRAYDAAGNFADSAVASVLVDSKAQSAPGGLTAATPTAATPVLSWQAPPVFSVAHYDVYRDGLLLGSTTGPVTTFSDATASEGVHDYAVLARAASSQPGVLSASFKVILDKTPPASGGAPNAQVGSTGSVQLAWPAASDALSGVAGYVVRRAAGGVPPAAVDGGTAVCALAATTCADAATASGTWSYGVFARDGAGNVALIGTVSNVSILDKTPPLAPTKLTLVKAKAKKKPGANITFTLRWVKPTATDLERVVVVLSLKHPPTTPADGKAIYKGLGTSTKVHLHAGQTGYLALFAFDQSGNVSFKPARTVVRLAALIPLRPLNGSVVRSSSPTLTWKALKGTEYYNVQVFVKGKRVLTGWPSKAAYMLPAGKLAPGTYVWFVWPAIKGKGGSPTFGKLIGRATFTYKK